MTNSSSLFNIALLLGLMLFSLNACGRKEAPRAPEGSIILNPDRYPKAVPDMHCHEQDDSDCKAQR